MAAHDHETRAALLARASIAGKSPRDLVQTNRARAALALADRALKGFTP